jgi:hypothetical protein
VILNVPGALPDVLDVSIETPTTANQLPIRICNRGAADLDPPALTYGFVVLR